MFDQFRLTEAELKLIVRWFRMGIFDRNFDGNFANLAAQGGPHLNPLRPRRTHFLQRDLQSPRLSSSGAE